MEKVNLFFAGQGVLPDRFFEVIFPQIREVLSLIVREVIYLPPFERPFKIDCEKIHSLDFRHWYYREEIFDAYIEKVVATKPNFLFLFDNPIGHERPWKIDIKEFIKGLSLRTVKLAEKVKLELPNTKLISPWICNLYQEHRPYYLDYLIEFDRFFDCHSILCANDFSSTSIGSLVSDFGKVHKESKKQAFLICAVPCGKNEEASKNRFEPFSDRQASQKLVQIKDLFSKMCDDLTLLYFGIGRDVYNPEINPSNTHYWDDLLPIDFYLFEKKWDWIHFLGLTDHRDRIKFNLLNTLLEMAKKCRI